MDKRALVVEWLCINLPVNLPGMRVGIQRGKDEVINEQSIAAEPLRFRFEVTVKPDSQDFAGPFVQGKRGERFIYLVWGTDFQKIGRSKIGLNTTLPWQLVEATLAEGKPLAATIRLSDAKGGPAFASLKSDLVQWSIS